MTEPIPTDQIPIVNEVKFRTVIICFDEEHDATRATGTMVEFYSVLRKDFPDLQAVHFQVSFNVRFNVTGLT